MDDNTLLKFPEGRYFMDELVRFTGFKNFGMIGDGATLVPAPADEYKTEARMIKLGTYYSAGQNLHVEGFTVDFTAPNTGLRAFDLTVTDGLFVKDIVFEGVHNAGTWGPMHVDIVNSDGYGVVKNIEMPEGGIFTKKTAQDAMPSVENGPTGFLLSPYHSGRLTSSTALSAHSRITVYTTPRAPDRSLSRAVGTRTATQHVFVSPVTEVVSTGRKSLSLRTVKMMRVSTVFGSMVEAT
ncbi:hypothetical protein ACFQJ8_10300 [Halocatena marina]|uniref:hypothetical protein n=1 Tax=Halocatena marina TaxID=2934937 RepID=UPI003608FCF3